nr:hypothetical protein [Lachnospiraceae bacterium]
FSSGFDAGLGDLLKYRLWKDCLLSVAEYLLCLVAGFVGECLFKACKKYYQRFGEGGAHHGEER